MRAETREHIKDVLEKAKLLKCDKLKVIVADEACGRCEPWRGKLVSAEGKTAGLPTLKSAIDSGLFHDGCSCSLGVHVKSRDFLGRL